MSMHPRSHGTRMDRHRTGGGDIRCGVPAFLRHLPLREAGDADRFPGEDAVPRQHQTADVRGDEVRLHPGRRDARRVLRVRNGRRPHGAEQAVHLQGAPREGARHPGDGLRRNRGSEGRRQMRASGGQRQERHRPEPLPREGLRGDGQDWSVVHACRDGEAPAGSPTITRTAACAARTSHLWRPALSPSPAP